MRISDWSSDVCSSDLAHMPPDRPPVHLCAAPMTHAAGVVALSLMGHGATNVVMNGVQLPALMETIERHGVTYLFLRSEERRVGHECDRTCTSRGDPAL